MRSLPPIFFLLVLAGTGCSDSSGLPDATVANVERVDTLWALVGTAVSIPSGYSVDGSHRVRTDISIDFDFAYDIQADGQHVFIPRAVLGIDSTNTVRPGFIPRTESFEAITLAPSDGYTTDNPVPIAPGGRYIVRGRVSCTALGVPKYAKLEVLQFDEVSRLVTFRVLTDDNCGFRGLEPGIPTR